MKRTNFPFFQVVRKVVPVAMLFGMIFLVGATDASAQNYLPREEAIENVAEYMTNNYNGLENKSLTSQQRKDIQLRYDAAHAIMVQFKHGASVKDAVELVVGSPTSSSAKPVNDHVLAQNSKTQNTLWLRNEIIDLVTN